MSLEGKLGEKQEENERKSAENERKTAENERAALATRPVGTNRSCQNVDHQSPASISYTPPSLSVTLRVHK